MRYNIRLIFSSFFTSLSLSIIQRTVFSVPRIAKGIAKVRKKFKPANFSQKFFTKKYEKENKSERGMPWLPEVMKDVVSCEKLRGFANRK